MWVWLLFAAAALLTPAGSAGAGAARLVCYVEDSTVNDNYSECTHLVYTGKTRGDKLLSLLKEYRKSHPKIKLMLRVNEADKNFYSLFKSKHLQGLEIHDAHMLLNKTQVTEVVEAARSVISSSGGGVLFLSLPAHPELLAKYYDLRTLVKIVDLMVVQTHNLGPVMKMTYHPSRLSGMWDMLNTDSIVDLVVGLGVPASKVVISLPATVHHFTLVNETLSTPGSPTVYDEPVQIDQAELCRLLKKGRWTLERDQDLSAPYAFQDYTWISFEDSSSVDVKGKYARIRGLAGLALDRADRDIENTCATTLREAISKVLNQQSRAPRAVLLRSLEQEILSAPSKTRVLNALQVSPYRISQVVDSDGVIHSIREDTRTEFSCSRQGYFVHPRSCARFYRCVKFDQLSPEYTVFEFDCPAGLAFDSRYEVCVWPGSLPDTQACPGSSEIAPVPNTRFVCPETEGYYADPENCRWFFACLDHGTSPLSAYEFRCPFGLGFDAARLKCDWPWTIPNCGNIGSYEAQAHGHAAYLTSAAGFYGQTADAINIAAHQSLVSGATLDNHVGIQSSYNSNNDAIDSNFIASLELANAEQTFGVSEESKSYRAGESGKALFEQNNYNDQAKYSSGSLILDDYRLPTREELTDKSSSNQVQATQSRGNNGYAPAQGSAYKGYSDRVYSLNGYKYTKNDDDYSGAYVHDPSGDYAEPYRHQNLPAVPYEHSESFQDHSESQYEDANSGFFVQDNSGSYKEFDTYDGDYNSERQNKDSGAYQQDNLGQYNAGVYRADGHIGESKVITTPKGQYQGYSAATAGNYLSNTKAVTGSSHTLTAGAINVGLVGKTQLVGAGYNDQSKYRYTLPSIHFVSHVSQPAVSINHLGTDGNNLDGYGYVTTPTSSGVPTTATPFAVTSSLPVTTSLPVISTYKTSFLPEAPKTSIKQIFGVSQPAVTYSQSTPIAISQGAAQALYLDQGYFSPNSNPKFTISSGYNYSTPSVKFEDGVSYTTSAPAISVTTHKPEVSSHNQQTYHQAGGYEYSSPTPVHEEPFKKVVAYTTGPSVVTYVQPTAATYTPQSFNQQIIHNVESTNTYVPSVQTVYHEPTIVQYKTPQPTIAVQPQVSTYQPQVASQGTIHTVDASRVNTYSGESGYNYEKPSVQFEEGKTVYSTPAPIVTSTYKPQIYSQQTFHKIETQKYVPVSTTPKYEVSYQSTPVTLYDNPILKYTQKVTPVTYVKPTTNSQAFSQHTIHNVEASKVYNPVTIESGYKYTKPSVAFQQPQTDQYTTAQPVVTSTYQPSAYRHQTQYQVNTGRVNTNSQEEDYEFPLSVIKLGKVLFGNTKPVSIASQEELEQTYAVPYKNDYYNEKSVYPLHHLKYEEAPKAVFTYSTPAHVVTSTYQPEVISHQTLHKVDASQVNTFAVNNNGLAYSKPTVQFVEQPKTVIEYSTVAPVVTSTYKPVTYSHQTLQNVVSSSYAPLTYQKAVSTYENPFLQYQTKITPVQPTAAVYTQTNKPTQSKKVHLTQEGYSYSQPEIQRSVETSKSYSDASAVSHQYYHQSNVNHGSSQVIVSTSPSSLISEDHFIDYEQPSLKFKAPEYIPPNKNNKSYSTVTSTSAPIAKQSSAVPQTYTVSTPSDATPIVQQSFVVEQGQQNIQDNYDYNRNYYWQYETVGNLPSVQQISFSTSHVNQPLKVESVHFSTAKTQYQQTEHQAPEIQVAYKSEEYLPPVVSTVAPIVTSTYRPITYSTVSTTREYLPPTEPKKEYLPPSTTARPFVKSTTPAYKTEPTISYQADGYLPPVEFNSAKVVNYESFGYNNAARGLVEHDSHVRQHNIVVENAKKQILGFSTVGPDAGLVSETYSTATPIVSSTYRQRVKSTTPSYQYKSTSEYNAPQYLPPEDQAPTDIGSFDYKNTDETFFKIQNNPYQKAVPTVVSTAAPVYRKQNIVIETAKSQLGYGTVGPDAGLVSPVSYSTEAYFHPKVTSAHAPARQGLFEVTPSSIPVRRTKPKVAVVTKINDFNPFLVRKLGAVCSCKSPILVLKGQRSTHVENDGSFDENYDRGDINGDDYIGPNNIEYGERYNKEQGPIIKPNAAPIPTSTFTPIIVPDDTYYEDLQEQGEYDVAVTPKNSESYITTPSIASTTLRPARLQTRVKTVTVAPTYKTVLLSQEVAPTTQIRDEAASVIESQAFDRYGPGGWRSRDETLQGSVDCQRAGLFRHPKQCNKFYACRWDCTKQRFTLHVFNCPVQLSFDPSIGACNWPSQGPACQGDTLLTNVL